MATALMESSTPTCWGSYENQSRPRKLTKEFFFIRTMFQHTSPLFHWRLWTSVALNHPYSSDFAPSDYHLFPSMKKTISWGPVLQWWWCHICGWWLFCPTVWKLQQCGSSTATAMEEVCGSQRDYVENKPHLVPFHKSILFIIWIFQQTLI